MIKQTILSGVLVVSLLGPNTVFAFRTCANEATDIYSAATRYVVGEIDFDDATGEAAVLKPPTTMLIAIARGITSAMLPMSYRGS